MADGDPPRCTATIWHSPRTFLSRFVRIPPGPQEGILEGILHTVTRKRRKKQINPAAEILPPSLPGILETNLGQLAAGQATSRHTFQVSSLQWFKRHLQDLSGAILRGKGGGRELMPLKRPNNSNGIPNWCALRQNKSRSPLLATLAPPRPPPSIEHIDRDVQHETRRISKKIRTVPIATAEAPRSRSRKSGIVSMVWSMIPIKSQ